MAARLRLVNAFTGWVLHTTWLRRLADRQVVELRYTTRDGRPISLPVMYAQRENTLVVLVGGPRGKTWWRHFRQPQPIRVFFRGAERSGTAHVAAANTPQRLVAHDIYAARYPDITISHDPLVIIDLDPSP